MSNSATTWPIPDAPATDVGESPAIPQDLTAKPPASAAGCLPSLVQQDATWKRLTFGLIALLLIGGFAYATQSYWVAANPGTDQNGYLVGGKMFADHLSTGFVPPDPFSFVGRMWISAPDGKTFYPKYPIGLPVIYAVMLWIGKSKGVVLAYLVNPACVTAALLGCYLLMRRFVTTFWATLGVILMACSPATLLLTNTPSSHASALCFVTWGMYLLLRWWQSNGLWRAIGAGFLLGYAATIRYSEGMLLLPIIITIALHISGEKRWWIDSATMLIAWAIPVITLLNFNYRAFGAFTGYDPTNESTGFAWQYFLDNWDTMARQLSTQGLFFILPASLLGLILMFAWNWRPATLLASWILPSLALYTSYYWAPDSQSVAYVRFFLTILPALTLCAVWCLSRLSLGFEYHSKSLAILKPIAAGVVVAVSAAVGVNDAKDMMETEQHRSLLVENAADHIQRVAPARSVIFAVSDRGRSGGNLLNHLQFATDYQLYGSENFDRDTIRNLGRRDVDPDEPNPLQVERIRSLMDRVAGMSDGDLVREQNKIMSDALAQGRRVFLVVPGNGDRFRGHFVTVRTFRSDVIATWQEPDIRGDRNRRNASTRGGRGFGGGFGGSYDRPPQAWQIVEVTLRKPSGHA